MKEDASYMADNDDKQDSGTGKKTLSLKGAPNLGNRPNVARSSRTVVVEKRTRFVPGGAPGAHAPHGSTGTNRPQQGGPGQSSGRPQGAPQGGRPAYDNRTGQRQPPRSGGAVRQSATETRAVLTTAFSSNGVAEKPGFTWRTWIP